nr:hypothetical protein [Tanacetum cinerariifolium]
MAQNTIVNLKPGDRTIILQGKVYRRWISQSPRNPAATRYYCILLYREGNAVKANMDANDIEYFKQMLEHGSAYRILDFNYLETSGWQQTIEKETKGFPEHHFSVVSYNQLQVTVHGHSTR